jgi:hypothetical protein
MAFTKAPIVLFTYNRPWHTRQTVEALQENELAGESELFIFSDGAKSEKDESKVKEVREYIKTIKGFKKVTIIERKKNYGLATNIIDGVTKIVNIYGKIIVLEDDIVTSPYFLKFMNEALEFYEGKKKVWHISGWNYPIDPSGLGDCFLWRVANCWGWATWADRWKHFNRNVDDIINKFDYEMIKSFDLGNSGVFWSQIIANREGRINTWAIFWYATIFLNKGLCLNPTISYVRNIGLDGSGTHCGNDKSYTFEFLNFNPKPVFPTEIEESILAVERVREFYGKLKKPIIVRIMRKIYRMINGGGG